jgi:hypothetical protein
MSEPTPCYDCAHVWMVLPSLNCKLCYDCGGVKPLDANKPILKPPGEQHA